MRHDMGHPDYVIVDMRQVERLAEQLAATDEPTIPSGLVEFLEGADDDGDQPFSGVDKAATPAERVHSEADLTREVERLRPQSLVAQRDSDANRDVPGSRNSALAQFSNLSVQIGPTLIQQFKSSYIPRVLCVPLPWCVGGPDVPRHQR